MVAMLDQSKLPATGSVTIQWLCVFMLRKPCCDVRYDFHRKTMFDSSLHSVVCSRRAHVLFTLFVFVTYGGVQHILCCVFVLFFFVLCILCCQLLWIVHFVPSVFSNVFYLSQWSSVLPCTMSPVFWALDALSCGLLSVVYFPRHFCDYQRKGYIVTVYAHICKPASLVLFPMSKSRFRSEFWPSSSSSVEVELLLIAKSKLRCNVLLCLSRHSFLTRKTDIS
jgi:hypothetical protein